MGVDAPASTLPCPALFWKVDLASALVTLLRMSSHFGSSSLHTFRHTCRCPPHLGLHPLFYQSLKIYHSYHTLSHAITLPHYMQVFTPPDLQALLLIDCHTCHTRCTCLTAHDHTSMHAGGHPIQTCELWRLCWCQQVWTWCLVTGPTMSRAWSSSRMHRAGR
jgi:hypothetical protein